MNKIPIYIFPCYYYYRYCYYYLYYHYCTRVLGYDVRRNKHPPSSPCVVLSAVLRAEPPDQKGKKKVKYPQAPCERHIGQLHLHEPPFQGACLTNLLRSLVPPAQGVKAIQMRIFTQNLVALNREVGDRHVVPAWTAGASHNQPFFRLSCLPVYGTSNSTVG